MNDNRRSAIRKPDFKKLEQEVAAFNGRFPVGVLVDYFEVIGYSEPKRYRTCSPAEVLSGHTAVVWLEGKSGCVCCSHCFAPPAAGVLGTFNDQPKDTR